MGACTSSEECASDTQHSKEVFKRFVVKSLLGDGASAHVFLARDRTEKTPIFRAVKIIKKHKNPQSQASASTAYTREVSSLQQLQHPHIVSMIDAYETAEDFVIVTEHCSGGSIYNWFEQHPELWTEQTIARLAKQLLQALLFCHKKNIVHRDIKPANFAMSSTKPDADVKLIDFGLSLQVPEDQKHRNIAGTSFFMAPEILDDKQNVDGTGKTMQASDMFSLGVMLFLLLSGRVPFGGSDNKQIKQNTLAGKYVWHATPPVSDSAKDLIAKLLCVNWRERITAAEALAHPWIENYQNNNVKLLEEAVRQQQQMGATRLIRKAIGGLLKKQGNETFLSQLQNVFASFDVDGDGKLDQGELREYMKASGYLRAEQAAEEFFQSEAPESSGVSFPEFQRAHLNGLLGMEGAAFRRAFVAFDHTGRGYVRLEDVLKELGPGEVADTFCELLAAVNGEGEEITLKTFIAALSVDQMQLIVSKTPSRLRTFMSASSTSRQVDRKREFGEYSHPFGPSSVAVDVAH